MNLQFALVSAHFTHTLWFRCVVRPCSCVCTRCRRSHLALLNIFVFDFVCDDDDYVPSRTVSSQTSFRENRFGHLVPVNLVLDRICVCVCITIDKRVSSIMAEGSNTVERTDCTLTMFYNGLTLMDANVVVL